LQTSQGYIIRILQHFATKLWNITNFVMLFQAVMKFVSRLVELKILVNWGMVHCTTNRSLDFRRPPVDMYISSSHGYLNDVYVSEWSSSHRRTIRRRTV
jgi:hypothetical protein